MKIWEIRNAFVVLQRLLDSTEEMENEEDAIALRDRIMKEWENGQEALADKLEAVSAMLKNTQHYAEACKAEKEKFAKKQKSAENQIDFIKNRMILPALKVAKVEKVEAGMHKVSIRHSKACDIQDMRAVPEEYIKVEERRSADKREILKLLKAGERVPGAVLLENESVQIK